MNTTFHRAGTVALALVVALLLCAEPGHAQAPTFRAESSDEHLWILAPEKAEADRFVLLHHAASFDGPEFSFTSPSFDSPTPPAGLGAWGDQVWVVLAPNPETGTRAVLSCRVGFDERLRMHHFSPANRLGIEPAMPGEGTVRGFVVGPDGPVVLLRAEGGGVRLLRLERNEWVEQPLPPGLDASRAVHLARAGLGGQDLLLMTATAIDGQADLFRRRGDGPWVPHLLSTDLSRVIRTSQAGNQTLLVSTATDGRTVEVSYLRSTRRLPLASLTPPDVPWTVVASAAGPLLLTMPEDGRVEMASIDSVNGMVGEAVGMTRRPPPTDQLLHVPLVMGLALLAVVVALVMRPGPTEVVALPAGRVLATPGVRLMGLLIDYVPAGILAMLIFQPEQGVLGLLTMQFMTMPLTDSMASLSAVVLTCLHGGVSEMIWGTSLGKAMMGLRVTSISGDRPAAGPLLVRNVFKGIMMLVPVLAVFLLLSRNHQGLGDAVARTLVVAETDPPDVPDSDPNDR